MAIIPLGQLPPRIRRRINTAGDCWPWTGARNKDGYGRVGYNGKVEYAHRLVYLLTRGHPGDLCVLHSCDNPPCVRPAHLFLGTHADNMRDAYRKGRIKIPGTKLDHQRAALIREIHATGRYTQVAIARACGVTSRTISAIVCGKRWV